MEWTGSSDTVAELLRQKPLQAVAAVSPDVTVLDATRLMNEWGIGCVIVARDGSLAGIFTERDVLRRVVGEERPPDTTAVREAMTVDVVCCSPEMGVEQVAEIMRNRRVRHVPVIDADERVIGLVSIGDVNAWRFSRCELALHQVEDYVFRRS